MNLLLPSHALFLFVFLFRVLNNEGIAAINTNATSTTLNDICNVIEDLAQTKQTNITDIVQDNNLETELWELCMTDRKCSELYHQHQGSSVYSAQNRTLFRFLLRPILRDYYTHNSNSNTSSLFWLPSLNLLCGNSLEQINRNLWLSILKSQTNREHLPLCDVNHRAVFDQITLTTHCECLENRLCTDELFNGVYFYVIAGVILVIAVIFFLLKVYKIYVEMRVAGKLEESLLRLSSSANVSALHVLNN